MLAPFTDLDTICTNDWWNRAPNPIHDVKVERDKVVAFGLYTVSSGMLKLSAQLYPLYPDETRTVRLELRHDGQWQKIASEKVNDLGWSVLFSIEKRPFPAAATRTGATVRAMSETPSTGSMDSVV